MNVSKIITGALKQLGVLAAGENARANELADALDCLHELLAQWAQDRHCIYKSNILILKLDGSGVFRIKSKPNDDCCEYEVSDCISCNSYEFTSEECTCGLHQPRPKVHLSETIQSVSDTAWLDGNKIQLIRDINNTASIEPVVYSMGTDEWLFYVSDRSAQELKIKAFTFPEHFECGDELAVPKHYERALRLSLALEIAPMFSVEPSMTLMRNQANAMRLLNKSNVIPIFTGNTASEIGIGVHSGWSY